MTWTRCGLRELMSIITPSRFWRGVGRDGGAAATYSPSSLGEIAISGDLGRSRARCRTWTRCGLRELMAIITPSRLWRGVGRDGSAAAAYSPSSLGEIAISAISGDLERCWTEIAISGILRWRHTGTGGMAWRLPRSGLFRKAAPLPLSESQHRCLFRKAATLPLSESRRLPA